MYTIYIIALKNMYYAIMYVCLFDFTVRLEAKRHKKISTYKVLKFSIPFYMYPMSFFFREGLSVNLKSNNGKAKEGKKLILFTQEKLVKVAN